MPMSIAQRHSGPPVPVASPRDVVGMKARQRIKIEEIRAALQHAGILTLDAQTKVLGLCRSTAWSILKPNHKSSGLSAGTINRMLVSPRLPIPVRQKIFEYVRERVAGLYGHSERRRREFAASLSIDQFSGFVETLGRNNLRRQRRSSAPSPSTSATKRRRREGLAQV
jgi:hypothetical protein